VNCIEVARRIEQDLGADSTGRCDLAISVRRITEQGAEMLHQTIGQARLLSSSVHSYPTLQQSWILCLGSGRVGFRWFVERSMQLSDFRVRRTLLPRTPVNKRKEKGRGWQAQARKFTVTRTFRVAFYTLGAVFGRLASLVGAALERRQARSQHGGRRGRTCWTVRRGRPSVHTFLLHRPRILGTSRS
jgi:hypothetical protein